MIDLCEYREIVAIAFGKGALAMADGLAQALPHDSQIDGILVVPTKPKRELRGWTTFIGGHPVPNEQSFKAGEAILTRLARCNDRSLVFFLISGGGSAMVEQPLDAAATLEDFQKLNAMLVGCGAPIEEINVIRKHLSAIKGGGLAAAAPRSMKITFAISDVPLGQESALASAVPPFPTRAQWRCAENCACI